MRQTTSGKEVMQVANKLTDFTLPSQITTSWPSQITTSWPSPIRMTLTAPIEKRRKRRGR
jgi:Domain of unknown function (DUF3432)